MTAGADRAREVSVEGEAVCSGFHFRRVGASRRPHDAWTLPAAVDNLSLDVLRSDSPIQRGECIVYRGDGSLVEYRVVSVRARRQDDQYWNAVLAERIGDVPIADLGRRPEPEIDRGVDTGGEVGLLDHDETPGALSELELLCDNYSPGAPKGELAPFDARGFPQDPGPSGPMRERDLEAPSAPVGDERIIP